MSSNKEGVGGGMPAPADAPAKTVKSKLTVSALKKQLAAEKKRSAQELAAERKRAAQAEARAAKLAVRLGEPFPRVPSPCGWLCTAPQRSTM